MILLVCAAMCCVYQGRLALYGKFQRCARMRGLTGLFVVFLIPSKRHRKEILTDMWLVWQLVC